MSNENPKQRPSVQADKNKELKRNEVVAKLLEFKEQNKSIRTELISQMLSTHDVPVPPPVPDYGDEVNKIKSLHTLKKEVDDKKVALLRVQQMMNDGYPMPEGLSDEMLFYRQSVDVYEMNYLTYVQPPFPPDAFQGLMIKQLALMSQRSKIIAIYKKYSEEIGDEKGLVVSKLTIDDRDLIYQYFQDLQKYLDLCKVGKRHVLNELPTLPTEASPELKAGMPLLVALKSRITTLRDKVVRRVELTDDEHKELIGSTKSFENGLSLIEMSSEKPDAYRDSVEDAQGSLLKKWNLPLTTGAFSRLVAEAVVQPRQLPSARKPAFTEQQWQILGNTREAVVTGIDAFLLKYNQLLFRQQTGMEIEDGRLQECLDLFVQLILKHETFERSFYPKGNTPQTYWYAMLGVFAQEFAEEYAEMATEEAGGPTPTNTGRVGMSALPPTTQNNLFSLIKRPPAVGGSAADIVNSISGINKAPPETRRLLEQGVRDAQRIMRAQGGNMTAAEFKEILKNVHLEEGFINKLLPEMGAATYVFYAMYMAQSEDKVKAALGLATFVIGGNAIGAVALDLALVKGVQQVGVKFGMPALARFRAVPAPVKIAFLLTVMYLGKDQVGSFVNWLDEQYPASQSKRALNTALGAFFVDEAFVATDERLYDNGVMTVNPETDWMTYLSREQSKITDPLKLLEDGRTFAVDKNTWNKRVRQAIEKEPSQIKKAQYRLEMIDEDWVKRQAHSVFTEMSYMKMLQTQLEELFKEKPIMSSSERAQAYSAFIDVVTSEQHDRNDVLFDIYLEGNSDHFFSNPDENGPGRNMFKMKKVLDDLEVEAKKSENEVKDAEQKVSAMLKEVGSDPEKIKDKNEYKRLQQVIASKGAAQAKVDVWKEYIGTAKRIAKKITVIKQMKFPGSKDALRADGSMYDRKTWFGDDVYSTTIPRLPDFIAEGLAQQVMHMNDRRRAENLVNINRYLATSEAVNQLGTIQTRPFSRRGNDHRRPTIDD